MTRLVGIGCLLGALALGACSSNKAAADAAKAIDAGPAGFESVSCTGITPDAIVTTGTDVFTPMATTITMGQVVEFKPESAHNL